MQSRTKMRWTLWCTTAAAVLVMAATAWAYLDPAIESDLLARNHELQQAGSELAKGITKDVPTTKPLLNQFVFS